MNDEQLLNHHLQGYHLHGAGWLDFAKKAASIAKPFIAEHGGQYGQQAAHVMGALGLGHRRRVARGAGWMDFAKKAASFAKPLIAQHGGQYGQQAANVMGALGLGHRRRHNAGNIPHFGNSYVGHGAGWMDFAKKAASFAKPLIAQHGGQYGQQAANVMGALGLGHRRRVARGAGWMDFAKKAASFAKPLIAEHGGQYGQQAANVMGALGLGHRRRKGGASASARAMMGLGGGRAERAAIVKSVMQERGVTLPQASKIVKLEGLY